VDVALTRVLVPATMRLLGRWTWWPPGPLAYWWEKHGLSKVTGDGAASAYPLDAEPEGPARAPVGV
jgi:trehalose monomycolate/heme transporter